MKHLPSVIIVALLALPVFLVWLCAVEAPRHFRSTSEFQDAALSHAGPLGYSSSVCGDSTDIGFCTVSSTTVYLPPVQVVCEVHWTIGSKGDPIKCHIIH